MRYKVVFFSVTCIKQVFPLLMVTGHDSGGYSMDDNEIGVITMAAGILQLVWQVKHNQLHTLGLLTFLARGLGHSSPFVDSKGDN